MIMSRDGRRKLKGLKELRNRPNADHKRCDNCDCARYGECGCERKTKKR